MSSDRGVAKEYMDIYTVEYYSAIKKNEIMPYHTKWSKSNVIWYYLYVGFNKMIKMIKW